MEGDGDARSWLGGWMMAAGDEGPVSNYYEDQKLMEGPLIKIGDYAHFRYFLLYRNGRFCYYELPMPKEPPKGSISEYGGGAPRRVHVTLTPQHLRGVIMLNASLIGKELAMPEDEYDSAVIQRGMAFNRKKLEMNLTGYSLTGQLTSWKLRAANDASYVKWEKAFRLALRPIWTQNTPYCLVCRQEFTLLFRPHHCRKCGTCMCDECSVHVSRLPMQGYYDVVRICRDCSPAKIQQSELKVGTRVLMYGMYAGKVVQFDATDDSDSGGAFVSASLEKNGDIRRVPLGYVELYSDTILSANRIKNTIRRHLAQTLFRAQLNFSTWNLLETVQEQKTVQMVRILNKSSSISELTSMVPTLSSYDSPSYPSDDRDEQELVRKSLEHYRGVHIVFPLRLEAVMKLIDQFRNGILLHRVYLHRILDVAHKLFSTTYQSPMNAIVIPAGVNLIIVGDLHGQLEDLLTILEKNGVPSPKTWFLFNGDFVDRGSHGVEVMILLLSFKLLYPDFVFFNRGNHEERMINENFGFEDEIYVKYSSESIQFDGADAISCSRKYSCVQLFQMFEDVFLQLPIFSLINDRVFVTHGGLSSHDDVTIDELTRINHRREVPTLGTSREDELFTHLLWSDPQMDDGWKPSERGAGVGFGPDITRRFCALNELSLVIRSHECQEEGYEITHDGMLLTIFSASSYCGSQNNKGAFIQLQVVENGNLKPHVVQYYSQPLQKLADAGKNEWRKKAIRLERRTMMSLVELIGEKKAALGAAFTLLDVDGSGVITKLQWKQALRQVLGIDARFLSYFKQLVGPEATLEDDRVDYEAFLGRYTVELLSGSVEWRRHLVRRVWLAFCDALAANKSSADVDAMDLSEKIRAAFDLFKSTQQPNAKEVQDATSFDLGKHYPVYIKSIRGIATQRSHENFFKHGFITYDVFRSTIQGKLGLGATLSEQQILELMQHMDQNGDGFVDFEEFRSFFAEFSRSDFLQELFDVDDVRAIDLLQQFGDRLASSKHFRSLKEAFEAFDSTHRGYLDAEDLRKASQTIKLLPVLDEIGARALHAAILQTFYGAASSTEEDAKREKTLAWNVFEDVFSPDSTRQRSLWMSSRNASFANLSAAGDDPTSAQSPSSSNHHGKYLSWADALLDSVKNSLNEQRLYLKFVFRMLDKRHRGYVSRAKFIAAMQCINQEHNCPLQDEQMEQLADTFTVRRPDAAVTEGGETDDEDKEVVEYPSFLKSLRVVDAEDHSPSRRRLHSASGAAAILSAEMPAVDTDGEEGRFLA